MRTVGLAVARRRRIGGIAGRAMSGEVGGETVGRLWRMMPWHRHGDVEDERQNRNGRREAGPPLRTTGPQTSPHVA